MLSLEKSFIMPKLRRGCKKAISKEAVQDLNLGFESHATRVTGPKRRRCSLSTEELKSIARLVLVENIEVKHIAKEFNIKPTLIWSLIRELKHDPSAIDFIRQKKEAKK